MISSCSEDDRELFRHAHANSAAIDVAGVESARSQVSLGKSLSLAS
jgi:hypothetical protein